MDRDHGRLLEQNDRVRSKKTARRAASHRGEDRGARDEGKSTLKLPFKNARVLVKPRPEKLCIAMLFYANVVYLFFPSAPTTSLHELMTAEPDENRSSLFVLNPLRILQLVVRVHKGTRVGRIVSENAIVCIVRERQSFGETCVRLTRSERLRRLTSLNCGFSLIYCHPIPLFALSPPD